LSETKETKADLLARIEELDANLKQAHEINKNLAAQVPQQGLAQGELDKTNPTPVDVTQSNSPAPAAPATGNRVGAEPAAANMDTERLKQLTQVRWYRSDLEREHSQKRQTNHKWPHAAPSSVLVASVGNSWKGDSWAKVMDMLEFAHQQGIPVDFREFQNRCFEPYDSLGTMRNEIFSAALLGGYEFCMMVDNDVLPEPDTLYRLIMHDQPLMSPYIEEPFDPQFPQKPKRVLHGPVHEPYTGVYPVKWNVLTMMLFKVNYIRALGEDFWQDSIGADEGYHFQKSYARTGVYPQVDSSVILKAGGSPLYPLTVRKSEQYEEVWKERRTRFDSIPDRSPVWPDDPRRTGDNVYLPFLGFPAAEEVQQETSASPNGVVEDKTIDIVPTAPAKS